MGPPTSRCSGVLLNGAALGNEGVLAGLGGGAGEAALDGGGAQGAQDLALGEHRWGFRSWAVSGVVLVVVVVFLDEGRGPLC